MGMKAVHTLLLFLSPTRGAHEVEEGVEILCPPGGSGGTPGNIVLGHELNGSFSFCELVCTRRSKKLKTKFQIHKRSTSILKWRFVFNYQYIMQTVQYIMQTVHIQFRKTILFSPLPTSAVRICNTKFAASTGYQFT